MPNVQFAPFLYLGRYNSIRATHNPSPAPGSGWDIKKPLLIRRGSLIGNISFKTPPCLLSVGWEGFVAYFLSLLSDLKKSETDVVTDL